jgi:hypothetical protein
VRKLKEEFVAHQRKGATETSAKAQVSGQQPGLAREETPVSQQKPKTTAGKLKATELHLTSVCPTSFSNGDRDSLLSNNADTLLPLLEETVAQQW